MTTKQQLTLIAAIWILLIILLTPRLWSATYYINPDSGTNGVGSEADPFNVCPTITAGNTYLWKRGTTQDVGTRSLTVSGVVIGAYDAGARPILTNNDNYIFQIGTAVTTFTVQDVRLSNCTYAILVSTGGSGSVLTVDNCEIDSATNSGMSIHWEGTVEVKNSTIHNNAVDGLDFYPCAATGNGYFYVHNNTFDSNGTTGANNYDTISCQGSGLIEWNTFTNQISQLGSSIDAAHTKGTGSAPSCIVRNNTIVTGEGNGIGLNGNTGYNTWVQVYNNYISGTRQGIYAYQYGRYDIYNNTIVGSTATGIKARTTAENNLKDLYIYNNIVSGSESVAKLDMPLDNGYTIMMDNNCLYESTGTDMNLYYNTTAYDTLAAWKVAVASLGWDVNSIGTDPLLTTYTIPSNSPCKDYGTTLATVTSDIVGTLRPYGSAYDIGAFESHYEGYRLQGARWGINTRTSTIRGVY